ncbi:MAG: hypothetical protein WC045_02065 [Patescibacteria group bacterium]
MTWLYIWRTQYRERNKTLTLKKVWHSLGVVKSTATEVVQVPSTSCMMVRPVQCNHKKADISAYAGIARGMYGDVNLYIQEQKKSWENIKNKNPKVL